MTGKIVGYVVSLVAVGAVKFITGKYIVNNFTKMLQRKGIKKYDEEKNRETQEVIEAVHLTQKDDA